MTIPLPRLEPLRGTMRPLGETRTLMGTEPGSREYKVGPRFRDQKNWEAGSWEGSRRELRRNKPPRKDGSVPQFGALRARNQEDLLRSLKGWQGLG